MKILSVCCALLFLADTFLLAEEVEHALAPGRYVLITSYFGEGGAMGEPVIVNVKKDGEIYTISAEDEKYTVGKVTVEEGQYVFDLRNRVADTHKAPSDGQYDLLTFAGSYPDVEPPQFHGVFTKIDLKRMTQSLGSFILFPVDRKE